MGKMLEEAFKERIGHTDHDTFIKVVDAFLGEIEDNDIFIVPMNATKGVGNEEPMLVGDGEKFVAACVVSDVEYVNDFEGQCYTLMSARDFLRFVKCNEFIQGIIVNPYSPYHCFLPRYDTLTVLAENNIEI